MARKGLKYMNGLAITSLVFIILTAIHLGILIGISFDDGSVKDNQSVTIAAHDFVVLEDLRSYNIYFIDYWVDAPYDVKVRFYITDYNAWNFTDSEVPPDYELTYYLHEKFVFIQDEIAFIVLVNDNDFEITVGYNMFILDDLLIPIMVIGIIFLLFVAIMILHTLGYFIKALIIVPITGGRVLGTTDRRRNGYSYQYVAETKPAIPVAPPKAAKPSAKAAPAAPPVPPALARPSTPVRQVPAIEALSENYVVSDQTKTYTSEREFFNRVHRAWDHTSIAERVLAVLALFFFLTGLVTTTWYLVVVLPLVLVGVGLIVFFTSKNRREKLVRIVESYEAIYVRDAAQILNTAPEIIRQDAWKIVRLGLGTFGFDPKNNVLFDVTKVDPSKKKELSPTAQTIHTQLVAEVSKKDEKKEEEVVSTENIKCPFCDREDNPPDSAFCIGCGASLKPAK
jgi:hypothetical protein